MSAADDAKDAWGKSFQDWESCVLADWLLGSLEEDGFLTTRKSRLFCCACVRRFWADLDERTRQTIILCEGIADQGDAVIGNQIEQLPEPGPNADWTVDIIDELPELLLQGMARSLVERTVLLAGERAEWDSHNLAEACEQEDREEAALVREVFGFPYESIPSLSTAIDDSVRDLALHIYDKQAFDKMPELGRMLDERGCKDAKVLSHCQVSDHVRGCWLLDAILDKK